MTDVVEKPAQPRPTNQRGEHTRVMRPYEQHPPTLRMLGTDRHAAIEIPETIGVVPDGRPSWAGPAGRFRTVEPPAPAAPAVPPVEPSTTGAIYQATGRRRPRLYEGLRRRQEPLLVRLAVLIGSGMLGGGLVVVAALALLWAVAS